MAHLETGTVAITGAALVILLAGAFVVLFFGTLVSFAGDFGSAGWVFRFFATTGDNFA